MFKLISSSSNYNFLGQKKIAIVISAFLVIISLTSFITKGLNWGIDFSSGYIIQLKFDKEVNISEIRTAFEDNGVTDSVMQSFGSNNEIIIKLKEESNFNKDSVNIFLLDTLSETHPFKILKLEFVGAQIGDELREKGEWAMLVALLSILVYIGFRFELLFGVG
ncbi:MAG: protein translocase subunit SecF, partial [Gammaproteobacteria bacterium]|nr:protein translocase subunit SecF [Gammaproteobacteria bacterium]